jgi:hypothetical protein
LFRVSYRMERSDYVAMVAALSRAAPMRLAFEIVGYLAIVTLIGLALAGSAAAYARVLGAAFSLPLILVTVPLLIAGPAILALRPRIASLAAALIYKRHALADREVVLDLTAAGIDAGSTGIYSEIGWGAVTRLIETPTHLLVQFSRDEALVIPRRAVPNEDEYRNLRGFIRARTGLSTSPASYGAQRS